MRGKTWSKQSFKLHSLIRSKDDEFTNLNSFLLTGKVKIAPKFVSEDFMPNPLILPP